MAFDSITNRGEYFSDHYLNAVIPADLRELRSRWAEAEGRDVTTPRMGLRKLKAPLFDAKEKILEEQNDGLSAATEAVLRALGFEPNWSLLELQRGEGIVVEVPIAAKAGGTDELPHVVAIESAFADEPDLALTFSPDAEPNRELAPNGLPEPVVVDGDKIREPAKALSAIFEAEHPPRHVLLVAGAVVVLATRGKWHEGRYLAVDLGVALERHDTKARGELETIAALFSRDSLVPDDESGEAVIEQLDAKSIRNATGVSEDLREGVRLAVEDIANEVIRRRLEKKLAVYEEPDFARRITQESLRFLYRILFLLYAESRPELEVVPAQADGYVKGYSLDRLRELTLTELQTEKARNGTHIHQSLRKLFTLVNEGHRHRQVYEQSRLAGAVAPDGTDDTGFIFQPLESDLFDIDKTPLVRSVELRNEVLQRVLARLLLSNEGSGKDRQFVSYSALGINQLGAVYERLMAYSGFLADKDYYELQELDKNGKPKKNGGTWVVPVRDADEFPDENFVTEEDPATGEVRRLMHPRGSFVFRLSGRDRQRSASYYTPEILTEFVVRHALEELLDQDGKTTPADEILKITICEPALGSGAFLNEAINQLAAQYLRRKQNELGETIDPEDYPTELQKVKAHFALHQAYGVDLNQTAVELAEVSLWLNAMHAGLKAPWFGLHLRRGNSLVGARRQTYTTEQLQKRAWLKAIPKDRKLPDGDIDPDEIHHFLLPADGWGAAAGAKEARELEPEQAKDLREWAKRIKAGPNKKQAKRLVALSRRVEALWQLAIDRLELAEEKLRRNLNLYGQPESPDDTGNGSDLRTKQAVEKALEDNDSALARLRLVMDAWCAMWFWPLGEKPPEWDEWLEMLEATLGVDPADGEHTLPEAPSFEDIPALEARERQMQEGFGMLPLSELRSRFPWLRTVEEIEHAEGFFHWELEFGHRMREGGFDLQVGNPPWVRPRWFDDQVLAEFNPWFGLHGGSDPRFREMRIQTVSEDEARTRYLRERAQAEGLTTYLKSEPYFPDLVGVQTNLYMVFMPQTWRNRSPQGSIGLLHPEGHFVEPKGGKLRAATYRRLRRHWHFVNEARLFDEIGHQTDFGVHVYSTPRTAIEFLMISNAHLPQTVDGSLEHDGSGTPPGIKTPAGAWDRTPHADRVLTVDREARESWAKLFDEPGTTVLEARLLRPHTRQDLIALETLAGIEERLADYSYQWTSGFHEKGAKRDGHIEWSTETPESWDEVVLQGPHFSVSNPFSKQPNENCRNNLDWSEWDLETLPERVIPRTNYQRACDRERYDAEAPHWNGGQAASHYRLIHRRMAGTGGVRSLQAALIPPGPLHVHTCHTLYVADELHTAQLCGLVSSIPFDYLFKVSGKSDVQDELVKRFPFPSTSLYYFALTLRTLRLNCLTRDYAPLWEELWTPDAAEESWTSDDLRLPDLASPREWTMATPLRKDFERRQALVEIDALGALILGISADQLCAMYRTQFGVLRKYEWAMRHDANGREVPREVLKEYEKHGEDADLGRYQPPFTKPDREADMRRAYEEFKRRVEG